MKKLSIIAITLLSILMFVGCGSGGGSTGTPTSTICGGDSAVNLTAGTTLSTSTGTCSPNIVIKIDGSWDVTNTGTSTDCCSYN